MASVTEKRAAFRKLHESGCFVLPNPWDQGSAKYLAASGFKALATTSAGYAWSHGLPDGKVSVEQVLAHVAELTGATDLPLNVDFEAGFADTPDGVGKNVAVCVASGASGLSIEDFTGDPAKGLFRLRTASRASRRRARWRRCDPDRAQRGLLPPRGRSR